MTFEKGKVLSWEEEREFVRNMEKKSVEKPASKQDKKPAPKPKK